MPVGENSKDFDAKKSFNAVSTSLLKQNVLGVKKNVQKLEKNSNQCAIDHGYIVKVAKSHIPSR